jgi:hypothetical protein
MDISKLASEVYLNFMVIVGRFSFVFEGGKDVSFSSAEISQ